MKNIASTHKKLGLLVVGLVLLAVGVTRSQAARHLLGLSPATQQDEPAKKGRPAGKALPPTPKSEAPVSGAKDDLAALRQQAQLSRVPTSHANLVDLLAEAETIIHGDVIDVTDGVRGGVPYTQVKLRVRETFRGNAGGEEFTFRQFGLLRPRKMSGGRMMLMTTPAGWATYDSGQEVVLFLHAEASMTGLRAPIGLEQGKFELSAGNALNQSNNFNLFADMEINNAKLTEKDQTMLHTTQGPLNAQAFLDLVRRAVTENWVERGTMRHVQK
jgi:hypothetical protein